MAKVKTAIGLMSGTSLDGIDAGVIHTDGESHVELGDFVSKDYDADMRNMLRGAIAGSADVTEVEEALTLLHADVVSDLLEQEGMNKSDVDIIGFHGQTIDHDPDNGVTVQIGNGRLLAQSLGIDVVNDFRRADVQAGGQGAPLVPIFHAALLANYPLPVAAVNIGGVANVTWIGNKEHILAFDTGPGNALIDDYIFHHTGNKFDRDGLIAESGEVDNKVLAHWLDDPFFDKLPPKSLDRNYFSVDDVEALTLEDAVATLTEYTAKTIAQSAEHFPVAVKAWYISGGGRRNLYLMERIQHYVEAEVHPIEKVGYNGDAVEAHAFGYLAVRCLRKLPNTFPSTTGSARAVVGGVFCPA